MVLQVAVHLLTDISPKIRFVPRSPPTLLHRKIALILHHFRQCVLSRKLQQSLNDLGFETFERRLNLRKLSSKTRPCLLKLELLGFKTRSNVREFFLIKLFIPHGPAVSGLEFGFLKLLLDVLLFFLKAMDQSIRISDRLFLQHLDFSPKFST